MKKEINLIVWVSLAILLNSCEGVRENSENPSQKNHAQNDSSPYKNLENYREIYVDGDSLLLHPFEVYREMKFEGVECGLYFYLVFSDGNPETKILFGDTFTPFSYEGDFDESLNWSGSNATMLLWTLNDTLIKHVVKGQTYKLIYSYKHDDDVLRTNVPMQSFSGYYIIDVALPGQKFERQIPFEY